MRGDAVVGLSSIADAAALTIRPPSPDEWVIHELYIGATCDIKVTNGTDSVTIQSPGGGNVWIVDRALHLTHAQYVTITNTSGGAAVFGYGGICTKGV